MKDEAAGEIPVAFVVRSNGSKITEDEIKQYISKQVLISFLLFNFLFIEHLQYMMIYNMNANYGDHILLLTNILAY